MFQIARPYRLSPKKGWITGIKWYLTLIICSLLTACGGDGSTSSTTVPGEGGETTTIRFGNGLGDNFVAGAIGIQEATIQSGESTQIDVSVVDDSGNPYTEPVTVTFTSDNCISGDLSTLADSTETTGTEFTTSTGTLTLTYTSNGCSGADALTATASFGTGVLTATGTINVEADNVLSVQFIEPEEPVQLSLRGIGGNETAEVRFRLVGQRSAPIVGESVSFSLSTEVGGLALTEDSAMTNNMGEVTAVVQSGTVHTTVVVTATHDSTGISGSSDGIDVSTGIPQADNLSLSISVFNPRAFNFDGTEVEVNIISSDQFGNPVPDGTAISFASPEGGTIPATCSTVSGRCSVTWISSDPRPMGGLGDRAGRAGIIAYTSGAEAFIDVNGNSVFDDGDTFDASMDLAEPFVDENENGMYDAGEFFFDFNSNGSRDLADGMWNGPLCEHSSLCGAADEVGIAETAVIAMSTDGVGVLDTGDLPPVGDPIAVEAGGTLFFGGLLMSDLNGNSMASGSSISFSASAGTLQGTTSFDVLNTTEPNGPYAIVLTGPATPETGALTLTVEVPDVGTTEFAWPIFTTCSAPSAPAEAAITQTTAVLSWSENGNATQWNVEYGLSGFIEGTGTNVQGGNPQLIEMLTAATDYDYYVSAICGGLRSASVMGSFTTAP